MDNKSLNRLGLIIKIVVGGLGLVAALLVWGIPNADVLTATEINDARDSWQMSASILFTISIIIITFAIIIGFAVYTIITNPKKSMKSLIAFGVAIGVFLLFYFIGTNETKESLGIVTDGDVTKGTIDFTNAGLIVLYIVMAISIVASLTAPLMGRYRSYTKKNNDVATSNTKSNG